MLRKETQCSLQTLQSLFIYLPQHFDRHNISRNVWLAFVLNAVSYLQAHVLIHVV
jgi:hypothetical protein